MPTATAAAVSAKKHYDHLPPSQLTPSCSRCRAKKLKCQYEDRSPHAACTNCLTKGLGHACHRDLRTPRGKKRLRQPSVATPVSSGRAAEIAALKKRLRALESEAEGSSTGNANRLGPSKSDPGPAPAPIEDESHIRTTESMGRSPTASLEDEDVASILETLAQRERHHIASSSATATVGGTEGEGRGASDTPSTEATRRTRLSQLLRRAKQDAYAADEVIVRELVSVFLFRANHDIGHIIYGPGFQRAVDVFLNSSGDELQSKSGIFAEDPACLAVFMLVLCIGFDFHPERPTPGRKVTPGFTAVESLRKRDIDPSQEWYAIAKDAFGIETVFRLSTMAGLQAACLFMARGQETRSWIRMVQRVAVGCAQDLGLHRLGRALRRPNMDDSDFIWLETGVRIWNYLVLRDWCALGGEDSSSVGYHIHPDHFTTRKPLNVEDHDLEHGIAISRPPDDWTHVSYFLMQLEMADIVRQAMDLWRVERRQRAFQSGRDADAIPTAFSTHSLSLRSTETIQRMVCEFVSSLPPYFALHSQVMTPGLVPVERWTLHQQLFHLMVSLCRRQLTTSIAPSSVGASRTIGKLYSLAPTLRGNSGVGSSRSSVLAPGVSSDDSAGGICCQLAEMVLLHHDRIRAICPIIDGFHVHFSQLFSACMVLVLDLICCQVYSGQEDANASNPISVRPPPHPNARNETRNKVIQIFDRLQASFDGSLLSSDEREWEEQRVWQQRGLQFLDFLLAYEQQLYHRARGDARAIADIEERATYDLTELARHVIDGIHGRLSRAAHKSTAGRRTSYSSRSGAERPSVREAAEQSPADTDVGRKQGGRRGIPQETVLPVLGAWAPDSLSILRANLPAASRLSFAMSGALSNAPRDPAFPAGWPVNLDDSSKKPVAPVASDVIEAAQAATLTLTSSEASYEQSTAAVLEWALALEASGLSIGNESMTARDMHWSSSPYQYRHGTAVAANVRGTPSSEAFHPSSLDFSSPALPVGHGPSRRHWTRDPQAVYSHPQSPDYPSYQPPRPPPLTETRRWTTDRPSTHTSQQGQNSHPGHAFRHLYSAPV